jgi:hypothetical protein
VKAPTLPLKCAQASFVIEFGIYFGCLSFSEGGSQEPRGRNIAIFIIYTVTSILGLLIYYVPSILKQFELSSVRRYAQIMANEVAKNPRQKEMEETVILQDFHVLLNQKSDEPMRRNDLVTS